MSKPFKLSAVLYGHSLDVRAVTTTPDNAIVSGSRDKTAKYWRPNEFNTGYVESITYHDQKNFVAAVLYLTPTPEHPDGLIVTGSNDNTILVYKLHEPFATYKITNHTDTVCGLSSVSNKSQFLSCSWDKTAKLWSLASLQHPVTSFAGHTAALWAVVQISNGHVVTACADRMIGMWSIDGQQIRCLSGHTDCVRDLCDLPDVQMFASVANDAQVKLWNYDGTNINTLYGHSNYIYCISRNPALGPNSFVTSDENYSVKCWQDGVNIDTIQLPAQSVWSVACLSNGDVVTGSSDGVIRIFTQNEGRFASAEVLKHFEEEINAIKKQACQEIGGYKVSDLPGREALYDPGKSAGQIKMIREADGVMAYSWVDDGDNSHWEKIGDVMGANEKANEGKTLYEGTHYDFVFSVDVEDGKPPLKLPYNNGEDVYEAANKFISRNHLPAVYLDQVVEFIQKNSKSASESIQMGSDYVDPFTGAARYQPAAGGSGFGASAGMNNDPLTGGNSYTTSSTKPASASSSSSGSNADPFTGGSSYTTTTTATNETRYFPHKKYLKFDSGDPKVILGKLKEFNEKIGDGNHKVDDTLLATLVDMCNAPCENPDAVDGFFQLLEWPLDLLFPVIDLMRLAIRHEVNGNQIVLKDGKKLIELFKRCLSQGSIPNNTLLTFRTLCNLFSIPLGEELIHMNQLDLMENITSMTSVNKNIEIAMATFLLNLSILCLKMNDEIGVILLSSVVPDAITNCRDAEAHFRGLVAAGNLLSTTNRDLVKEIKYKLKENGLFVDQLKSFMSQRDNDLQKKRSNCAQQIQQILS